MVKIRYLTKEGDTAQQLELKEATKVIEKELDRGNLVYDEDERRIVEKATLGQVRANSNIAVFPRIQGG
jgi:molybdopterin converting factor small subunit